MVKHEAHTRTVESQGATKLQVIKLGIGGNSSTNILRRMPSEIQSRQSANWPFTFIFSFGTNDERSIDGKPETLPFVPIRALFEVVGLASLYSYDRLHPNDAGHKLIADAVLPVLDSLLGSDA